MIHNGFLFKYSHFVTEIIPTTLDSITEKPKQISLTCSSWLWLLNRFQTWNVRQRTRSTRHAIACNSCRMGNPSSVAGAMERFEPMGPRPANCSTPSTMHIAVWEPGRAPKTPLSSMSLFHFPNDLMHHFSYATISFSLGNCEGHFSPPQVFTVTLFGKNFCITSRRTPPLHLTWIEDFKI